MTETMLLINRISNRVKRAIDREVSTLGITAIQGRVIAFIHDAQTDVFQKDLEEYLEIRGSSVTAMIQSMEKNGLLHREAVLKDQRLKKLVLTDKAFEIHSRIMILIKRIENEVFLSLSKKECEILNTLLEKVISCTEK